MRLESLRLQNFRGFEDATLPLNRPLTVLFGENGSGKSSVLRALGLCFTMFIDPLLERTGQDEGYRPNASDIRTQANKLSLTIGWRHGDHVIETAQHLQRRQYWLHGSISPVQDEIVNHRAIFLPILYEAERYIAESRTVFDKLEPPDEILNDLHGALMDALNPGRSGFRSFFQWFKEREDVENRRKVQDGNLALSDPQLLAVRTAIETLLPGYTNPRMQHDPFRLEIMKAGNALSMDQLSDGENQCLAITGDIARRLSMVYPNEPKPLEQEAVILVDEVELHLHPSWQRRILPAWRRIFPGCQFIVTTHSPQVISEVPNDAVFLVKDFQFIRPGASTEGRDSNSILEETMGTPERPPEIKAELSKIASLIDDERYSEARDSLDKLAQRLTEQDNEVVRLRTMLHFMEGARATDSQG